MKLNTATTLWTSDPAPLAVVWAPVYYCFSSLTTHSTLKQTLSVGVMERKSKRVWESPFVSTDWGLLQSYCTEDITQAAWTVTSNHFSLLRPVCFDSVGRFLRKCQRMFFVLSWKHCLLLRKQEWDIISLFLWVLGSMLFQVPLEPRLF